MTNYTFLNKFTPYIYPFDIIISFGLQFQGMPIEQKAQLENVQKRFNQLKSENNKLRGNMVLTAFKPFFKFMPDTDFQAIFSIYVTQFSLNDNEMFISVEELKYIYLRIKNHFNKIRQHAPFGQFVLQSHIVLKKSQLSYTNLPTMTKQPIFNIFNKQLTQILPYQIIFFDSLYKRDERPSMKTPEKLTEQSLQQPYVCYDYKIYESLLENYEGSLMKNLDRLFYKIIDFRWIEALMLLKQEILIDQKFTQAFYLVPVLQNLKQIQDEINKNPDILKPIFLKRKTLAFPNIEHLEHQIIRRINEIKNLLDFVCSYCAKIYPQFKNPYIRAICYFLGKKFQSNSKFEQICENQKLGVMIKFLFARRFLAPPNFNQYYSKFLIQTKQHPKIQHIMFLKNKADVVQIISNYWDQHPTELQKVALTCGIVLHKLGKGFNKQYPFLQQMVRLYQELLKNMKQKQVHKEYMLKMMAVRSSKQPIWQDVIVKPQFRLNCQPRNDDCVFLSMLQKFLYGGQQKWNKLKSKSSVADPIKKHYQVQAKYCPYCNYPTPRCSICLQQIKIFTVKSYLNQQIKRKCEKQQKPYMKLNQPLEQALIWCPSCSHGGHFGHLQTWFKMNKGCPVDKCQCKCQF